MKHVGVVNEWESGEFEVKEAVLRLVNLRLFK